MEQDNLIALTIGNRIILCFIPAKLFYRKGEIFGEDVELLV